MVSAMLPEGSIFESLPNGTFESLANGTIVKHKDFPSVFCLARSVHVWLPAGYDEDPDRYSVLYMQDGQNLFQEEFAGFGITWKIAEQLNQLLLQGNVRKTIVVGVFNTVARDREYMPDAVFERLDNASQEALVENCRGRPQSEGYLRFLVEELKPFIDSFYRTKTGQAHTFVGGSSLGGLISLHALLKYPQIYGTAFCLSPHWPMTDEEKKLESADWKDKVTEAFSSYLRELLPPPGLHRFWFDHGDEGLDAYYVPYQQAVDAVFEEAGYTQGQDWVTKSFPGGNHDESSWQARVSEPISFALRQETTDSVSEQHEAASSQSFRIWSPTALLAMCTLS